MPPVRIFRPATIQQAVGLADLIDPTASAFAAASAKVPGHLGAEVLRADRGKHTEFRLITYWDSWEAVQRFAGEDIGTAVHEKVEHVRVTATDAWLRIDTRYGVVVRRRHALLPLLV